MVNKILLIFFITSLGPFIKAQELDYLDLAAVLIKDKNYQRAHTALTNAKKDWDEIDQDRYRLLKGLYLIRTDQVTKAIELLQQIQDPDITNTKIAYLSEAFLKINDFKNSLVWIKKLNVSELSKVSLKQLKSKILYKNGLLQLSFSLLDEVHGPGEESSKKIMIHRMIQLNLFEEAFRYVRKVIQLNNTAVSYIKMAKYLLGHKLNLKAQLLLEEASLIYPLNPEVTQLLAATYDLLNMPSTAVDLYTRLAYLDPKFAYLAASYLNQKGQIERSEIINMLVQNPQKKLSQKLTFYIEAEKFDLAGALEKPLRQHGSYKDDEIKYAMAYTYLVQGRYNYSLALLKGIKKQKLISKSLKLIELANDCKASEWDCYGTL